MEKVLGENFDKLNFEQNIHQLDELLGLHRTSVCFFLLVELVDCNKIKI